MSRRPADAAVSRRTTLRALAGAATFGSSPLAGCASTDDGSSEAPTVPLEADRARQLATQFAPTWYFDRHERWFPTDPRSYTGEVDGQTVVDGFDALDGYAQRFEAAGGPPDPTVFYHGRRYEGSSLGVVQWWAYSAFDQFTINFHWHDWEVIHGFVDLDSGNPQLYVASAHSRNVPNNEFIDPVGPPQVLSELGSHSSGLSVNDQRETFQRWPDGTTSADVTNAVLEGLAAFAEFPAAYGLPRDEGFRLPYLVPELDGVPIHEHPDLPAVGRADLIDEALTVGSFADLESPPGGLPSRETGLVFAPEPRDGTRNVAYELVPTTELEHIAAFTGPRLSFPFAVPGFVEDLVESHIKTTGVPWNQDRYDDPAADISDPAHRQALSERYRAVDPPTGTNRLVAAVRQTQEAAEAPDGEGLRTTTPTVESVALIESKAAAVPTSNGVLVAQDLPAGDHRLTVNTAGNAPHSETVSVGTTGRTVAGVEGSVAVVPNEQAVKLGVDPEASGADLRRLAVEDDFAGRLYAAPLSGPDAVYVHRGGAYAVEVEDADAELGAFRVNPTDVRRVDIERPDTGKAVLATYVADVATESRAAVEGRMPGPSNAVRGLVTAMAAVVEAAQRAAERAEAGNPTQADEALQRVATRLAEVADRLATAREDLPGPLGNALEQRIEGADRRTQQALAAEKL